MAIRIDSVSKFAYTDTVPSTPSPLTVCFWMKIIVDRDVSSVVYLFSNGSAWDSIYLSSTGTNISIDNQNSGQFANGQNLSVGTWYHVALVRNGASHILYVNGAQDASFNNDNSFTSAFFIFGSNTTSSFINGSLEQARAWNAALSQSEIQAEMFSETVVRTANLWASWPLISNGNGVSGNGRNLIVFGSPSWVEGINVFSAQNITTGNVSVASVALVVRHVLTANNILNGSPTLAATTIQQRHSLIATAPSIGPPSVSASTLTQKHSLSANGVESGATTVGSPVLSQTFGLSAADLTTQNIIVESVFVSQKHILGAESIQAGQPVLGSPNLAQSGEFLAIDIVVQPLVEAASLSQKHNLLADNIQTGSPVLETPSLTGSVELAANAITTQAPVLESVSFNQKHILNVPSFETENVVIQQTSISQRHNLIANILLLGPPILGNANISTGQRAFTRTTLIVERPIPQHQVTKTQRIFVGGRRNKVYEVI